MFTDTKEPFLKIYKLSTAKCALYWINNQTYALELIPAWIQICKNKVIYFKMFVPKSL